MEKEKKKLWDILKENKAKIFFTCLSLLILCASTTAGSAVLSQYSYIGVLIAGFTQLQRTLHSFAQSMAMERVQPRTAALEAA